MSISTVLFPLEIIKRWWAKSVEMTQHGAPSTIVVVMVVNVCPVSVSSTVIVALGALPRMKARCVSGSTATLHGVFPAAKLPRRPPGGESVGLAVAPPMDVLVGAGGTVGVSVADGTDVDVDVGTAIAVRVGVGVSV